MPKIKPFVSELTDSGPGVGVSNHQVRLRFAEMCLIQQSESRIRIHMAPGDSGQNEVERTNSYIGDAMVDSAALEWQHYGIFEGIEETDIEQMTYDELQLHINEATEKNGLATAEELTLPIDDEPRPSGYMRRVVSSRMEEISSKTLVK